MKLELQKLNVKNIVLTNEDSINAGTINVDADAFKNALMQIDPGIESIELDIARPGDSYRIIPVKDVIEPRVKREGKGEVFPGFFGNNHMVGEGKTLVLKGCAVVTTGNIVGFQEGIIDMSGVGAEYTPFSKTINLVVKCIVDESLQVHHREKIVRLVGLQAAKLLAEIAIESAPDEKKTYEYKGMVSKGVSKLPRVGYVYMLQSQGLLHDTYVYGVDAKQLLPSLISPTEVMDGAIVSGNCVSACDKVQTYIHTNNPIIEELFERDGKDFDFVGVIITNENVTLKDKETSSRYTAKLASMLELDAAVISEEGFGNPDADLVMNCNNLEELGIKTVLVTDEYAGRMGEGQSLADVTEKGNAVVTAGNANQVIVLPKMDKVVGFIDTANVIAGGFDGSLNADGTIETEIQAIIGATNELGYHYLTSKGF